MILQNEKKGNSSTLILLCILTILGNAFLILKGIISFLILLNSNDTRSHETITNINLVFFIEFITYIGSITGAIIMLNGKRVGHLIYQISGLVYLISTALYAIFCFLLIIVIVVGLLQLVYMGICLLFMILFFFQKNNLQ
jgi:hypothetical protein